MSPARRRPALLRRHALLAALAGVVVVIVAAADRRCSRSGEVERARRHAADRRPDPGRRLPPLGLAAAVDGTPWVPDVDGRGVGSVRPIEDDKAGEDAHARRRRRTRSRAPARDLWASGRRRGGAHRRRGRGRSSESRSTSEAASSGSGIAAGEGALRVTDTIDDAVIRADEKTARPVGEPIAVGGEPARRDRRPGRARSWVPALRTSTCGRHTGSRRSTRPTNRAGLAIRDRRLHSSNEVLAVGAGGVWSAPRTPSG